MRLTGYRRGNPTVRFMVEQSARRRMCFAISPEHEAELAPGNAPDACRWSREFFERLHAEFLPRMAPVADAEDGRLLYYGAGSMSLWAFVTSDATTLAYEHEETPVLIHERARRWLACLATHTAPGLASPHWGDPVYGARIDPLTGELDVVWACPGEWCDAVMNAELPAREWDAPRSWSEVEVGAEA